MESEWTRRTYPSDVSDDEWAFVAPYLTLMAEDAPQRVYSLRELFDAARGCVLLPRRWVVERTQGWAARFRRLARDDERLSETRAGLHLLAFVSLMVQKVVSFLVDSS